MMALANFFDKIALNAGQVLQGMDWQRLGDRLSGHRVALFFDAETAALPEGRMMLDLSVRLLARFYPNLTIRCSVSHPLEEELTATALSIHPTIGSFDLKDATMALVAGRSTFSAAIPTFYIGSTEWTARFSPTEPQVCGSSSNPFGAGTAACIGVANVFRQVFKDLLPHGAADDTISFSLLEEGAGVRQPNISLDNIDIQETLVAGLGAIGNGFAWALKNLPGIRGQLVVIDKEHISLSNLQRYILAGQLDVGVQKSDHIATLLNSPALRCIPVACSWEEYLALQQNWKIDTVIAALDSAVDRIAIQAALPKIVFNGWTQSENIGVSRHTDFLQEPCVCCLYHPTEQKKSRSQEVADNLYLPAAEVEIRRYLANNFPVDGWIVAAVHQSTGIPMAVLNGFLGQSLDVFYSAIVCGGAVFRYSGQSEQVEASLQVPCAFESALAGILLAAELVKYKSGLPVDGHHSFRMNLMRPLSGYYHNPEIKREHCICRDRVFREVYQEKWG